MAIAKIICSLVMPVIIWLLYGMPDLHYVGNLAILIVVTAHLYAAIWVKSLFSWFRGDAFTYGMVAMAANGMAFATTFLTCWIKLLLLERRIESLSAIAPIVGGISALGILMTVAIPMFTSRHTTPLPVDRDRGELQAFAESNH